MVSLWTNQEHVQPHKPITMLETFTLFQVHIPNCFFWAKFNIASKSFFIQLSNVPVYRKAYRTYKPHYRHNPLLFDVSFDEIVQRISPFFPDSPWPRYRSIRDTSSWVNVRKFRGGTEWALIAQFIEHVTHVTWNLRTKSLHKKQLSNNYWTLFAEMVVNLYRNAVIISGCKLCTVDMDLLSVDFRSFLFFTHDLISKWSFV